MPVIMALALALLLPELILAQGIWEVRGVLTGRQTGWSGAIVSIPTLRVGSYSGNLGTFKITADAPSGCYELLIRAAGARSTAIRFVAPDTGRLDLGLIPIDTVPVDDRLFRRRGDTLVVAPQDTALDVRGECDPGRVSRAFTWITGRALVLGSLSRGTEPLRDARVQFFCGRSVRVPSVRTDDNGQFRLPLKLQFPLEQTLGEGGVLPCAAHLESTRIDGRPSFRIEYSADSTTVDTTHVDLRIPDARYDSRVVYTVGIWDELAVIPNVAAFRAGVMGPGDWVVSLESIPQRVEGTLYQSATCGLTSGATHLWGWESCPLTLSQLPAGTETEILPVTFRIGTGRMRFSTGAALEIAVSSEIARMLVDQDLRAYARVPVRYGHGTTAYIPCGTRFDDSVNVIRCDLTDMHFDDELTKDGTYQAQIILATIRSVTR